MSPRIRPILGGSNDFDWLWSTAAPSLCVVDGEVAKYLHFVNAFDALCQDFDSQPFEGGRALGQIGQQRGVAAQAADDGNAQLDEVRLQGLRGFQIRIAATRIIQGDTGAAGAQFI
ncbi:hypothetical protein [Thauera sp. GDN1]|jgi:hypothetical protein|uniref:hypothetical protein n=1 Tax=Thauera sp. GDN1 TaxID=2944810 RepID=UPI00247B0250|nr:hypothetical protein [Thauera sp. GDN1]